MTAPSEMPLVQDERQGVGGNAMEALIAGPKGRYAVHRGYRLDRDSGF